VTITHVFETHIHNDPIQLPARDPRRPGPGTPPPRGHRPGCAPAPRMAGRPPGRFGTHPAPGPAHPPHRGTRGRGAGALRRGLPRLHRRVAAGRGRPAGRPRRRRVRTGGPRTPCTLDAKAA
jgi:hypothetical protein